ncbi:hypothetical protein JK386_06720 [Nocardioides sp. zg-536]|uniref:Uncharacterized protein n=1 Tax=Nocardioides faecalis TaxID=2803858 RepID=A0A938Y5H2_9ACTN|nr:hypothetical protein [Nocardioides faecalis]MBM9459590.1 hypothetical protein [Nocardioides faecalis]MBS4753631.1 hypothetical protein [Nocardioides faecalis]QVI58116.1 hypothetical protein KG111_14015 [Nocardioides faecalis]
MPRHDSAEPGRAMPAPVEDAPGLLVDVQRLDAHPGDSAGLRRQAELPADATLHDVLTLVLEPFLRSAPRASWLCRARGAEGWVDIATVVTSGPEAGQGARLLREHTGPAREFAGGSRLEIAARPH